MTPVLSIRDATLAPAHAEETGVAAFSLELGPGDQAWLATAQETAAVDLACGLRDPATGAVRFAGEEWRNLSPARAAAARGKIGRVFWDTAWLSNLDLDEGITLAARHLHPGDPRDWHAAARDIGSRLGFTIPSGLRPAFASRRDLQRAQFVRALLLDPLLLLLERPARDVESADWTAFRALVEEHRARGAAVLWVGPEDARMNPAGLGLTPLDPSAPPAIPAGRT